MWPFKPKKKYAEVWIHRPGDEIMRRFEAPINDRITLDAVLTKPGPLRLSNKMAEAVLLSKESIIRIAPWSSVIYCRGVRLLEDPDGGEAPCRAVTLIDRDADCLTIVMGLDGVTSSLLRSFSHHEAYHCCEPLLTEYEIGCLQLWAQHLLTIDKPPFVASGDRDHWWSLWYERVTWSFERYCYVIDPNWVDEAMAQERGFNKELGWFPSSVIDVFDKVWRGEVGKRNS